MNTLGLTGLSLLYVGVVLFINGLWLLNQLDKQEITFIDLFVGIISFLIAYKLAFHPEATIATMRAGAFTFLFSCTYLWVAYNQYRNANGKGLGWFCLFVAITAVPITYSLYNEAHTLWQFWFTLCWALWAILWFFYFLNLVFSKVSTKTVGIVTILIGIISAWVPGYLILAELIS